MDLRLREPDHRAGPAAHPGRPAQVAAHRPGHEGRAGRRTGTTTSAAARSSPATTRSWRRSARRCGSSSRRPSCSTCRASASTASTRRAPRPARPGAIYKRSRGRHRPGRPGQVPRLADVRHRLPVQEDLLQPPHRQGREVHVLLPADRGRHPDGLRRDLRRAGCATSAWSSTTPTACSTAASYPDEQDLYAAQRPVFLDPADPEVQREAEAGRHPARLDRGGPALAGVGADQPVRGRAAAAPGVPHAADGLVHPAAVAGRRRAARTTATTPRTPATCSARSTRCASR